MNPWIIVLIVLAVFAVAIVGFSGTPQGRGFWGERYIRFIIGKTKAGKRYVINNYMIMIDGKSSQIDHILINENGIFIIETKNYSGRIYGKDNQQEWTQVLNYGKIKNHFYNPVKQNATHIYRLAKILPDNAPLIPVIVFVKDNVSFIEASNVIGSSLLGRFVKTKRDPQLTQEQMKTYYDCIVENKCQLSAKEHVTEIRQMKANIEANICPRCGGNLIKKTGKYVVFWGCENYPKCTFIKK